MTTLLSRSLSVACVAVISLGVADFSKAADVPPPAGPPASIEYTRLVPANAPPPPVDPTMQKRGLVTNGVTSLIEKLGPWYNQHAVSSALQQSFEEQFKDGVAQAKRGGQAGFLIRVQVVSTPTDGGPFYSLRGHGAALVGVGPDPNAVCLSTTCFNSLEPALKADQTLAQGSGYVWVVQHGAKFDVQTFDTVVMESRARTIWLDSSLAQSVSNTYYGQAIRDYAAAIEAAATKKSERQAIEALIASRSAAMAKADDIEKRLNDELRRAERAAKVSADLNMIAGVLSLASAISMANSSTGLDFSSAKSFDELTAAVAGAAATSQGNAQSLMFQRTRNHDGLTGTDTDILTMGKRYGLDPHSVEVMKPK